MAFRIERKGNYFRLIDSTTGEPHIERPAHSLFYRDNTAAQKVWFYYGNPNVVLGRQEGYSISSASDGIEEVDGHTGYNYEDVLDWLSTNTGANEHLTDGAIDVILQDSTSDLVIVPFSQPISDHLFAVQGVRGTYTVQLDSTATILDGQLITIFSPELDKVMFTHSATVTGTTITIHHPLDADYPVGSFFSVGEPNLAVDGSLTPQIFGVRNPSVGEDVDFKFDIVRMTFKMLCSSALDLSKFGDIAGGIDRGVLVRRVDGTWTNLFHFDSNGELKTLAGTDLDIEAGIGNQQDGLTARLTFGGQNKMGSVIRIGKGEDAQCIIQDDLSSLIDFKIYCQGSRVRD